MSRRQTVVVAIALWAAVGVLGGLSWYVNAHYPMSYGGHSEVEVVHHR